MSLAPGNQQSYGAIDGVHAYPPPSAPPYPQQAPPYPPQGLPNKAGDKMQGQGQPGMMTYPQSSQGAYQEGYGYDQGGEAAEPSCPPLEAMDQVPGYSSIGFESAMLPPPAYEEVVGKRPEAEVFKSTVTINAEDAREAILEHASDKCCWGTGPARDMIIRDVVSSSAYRYTLETFGEGRSTKWHSEPYHGGNVMITGPPPGPWDIMATAPQLFRTSKLDIEVPNTASVKPCHKCRGRGCDTCFVCNGSGRRQCPFCNGSGFKQDFENGRRPCTSCQGGYTHCGSCGGRGTNECRKCKGRGSLRWYILLTVKWTNHLADHVEQRTALPGELVKEVSGELAFDETYPRVWPITTFPVREINSRSAEIVQMHSTQFTTERILMQRQRVHCVPVSEVQYSHKSMEGQFIVYGMERKVHAPDYPAKCCCGCSVL